MLHVNQVVSSKKTQRRKILPEIRFSLQKFQNLLKGQCGTRCKVRGRWLLYDSGKGIDRPHYAQRRGELDVYDLACHRCGDLALSRIVEERRGIEPVNFPRGASVWNFDDGDASLNASLNSVDVPLSS